MTAAGVNFNFGITVTPAQKAFGYTVTDAKTIDVTLEKFTANAVGTTTYLEVALPKVLNLDGDKVTLNSTDLGISGQQLTISPTDNTLSGNTRTLKIAIPVTQYNLSGSDNGDGTTVTFTIPVVYTVPAESAAE